MAWPVQKAKQKFDKLVQCALDEGPQVVTRQGEDVVVVLAKEEYNRLKERKPTFKEVLLQGPDFSLLDLERSKDPPRDAEL